MLLLILPPLIGAALGLLWILEAAGYSRLRDGIKLVACSSAILAIMGALISITLGLGIYFATTSDMNKMTAFYDYNRVVYQESFKLVKEGAPATELGNSGVMIPADGLKNFAQIRVIGDNLGGFTREITDYNSQLQSHRHWEDHILTGWMWQNVPKHVLPIAVIMER